MKLLAALAGSPIPPRYVSAAHAWTEKGVLKVTNLVRAESAVSAMDGLPAELPSGPPGVDVLIEVSDFIGGPLMTQELQAVAGISFRNHYGAISRRKWWIHPLQLVTSERLADSSPWKTDVPRRDVLAAFVSAGFRGRVKVHPGLPFAGNLEAGIAALRQRRETSTEAEGFNADEDLALCVALLAWWHSLERESLVVRSR